MRALHPQNWKIIHLQRQNLFRQALSNRLANARKVWHRKEDSAPQPIYLRPEDLLREVKFFERLALHENEALKAIPHLKVVSEQDLLDSKNHQATANRIFDYLGLSHAQVRTDLQKVSASRLDQNVTNFPELVQFFRQTPSARFLEDEARPPAA